MIAILAMLSIGLASPVEELAVLVHAGETVESIAAALGVDAAQVRALNGLESGAQPLVGTVLRLQADGAGQEALLLSLSGRATVTRPGAPPVAAAVADLLPVGSTVCTAADGYATIRLAVSAGAMSHDDISLFDQTCVTIDSAWADEAHRSSLVSLGRGSVRVRASDSGGGVTVQSEAGVTSGSGGGYRVTAEDRAARTEALSASVSVFGAGVEVPLRPGQGSRVREGEAPGPPVDLIAAGSLLVPTEGQPLRRPDFAWSSVDRALGYRVELSVAPDFSEVVLVEEVPENAWSPDYLFVPYRVPGLWWRVASFDRLGFLGIESPPRYVRFPAGVGP